MVQWLKIRAPNTGDLGSIPCRGTRSHMPQLKIPHASAKTRHSQINNKIINFFLKTSLIVFSLPCNLLILWPMLDSILSVTLARNLGFIFHWFSFTSSPPSPHPVNQQVYLVNLLQSLPLHSHPLSWPRLSWPFTKPLAITFWLVSSPQATFTWFCQICFSKGKICLFTILMLRREWIWNYPEQGLPWGSSG